MGKTWIKWATKPPYHCSQASTHAGHLKRHMKKGMRWVETSCQVAAEAGLACLLAHSPQWPHRISPLIGQAGNAGMGKTLIDQLSPYRITLRFCFLTCVHRRLGQYVIYRCTLCNGLPADEDGTFGILLLFLERRTCKNILCQQILHTICHA